MNSSSWIAAKCFAERHGNQLALDQSGAGEHWISGADVKDAYYGVAGDDLESWHHGGADIVC